MSMRVFIGIDPRQPVAFNVLQWSIHRRATKPVQVIPLILPQLPIKRRGLTDFTFSRYLPPYLCGFKGVSVFMDADMLVLGDVNELREYVDGSADVYVVKGPERFEWPSMMVFDNERCQTLTPEYIDDTDNNPAKLDWTDSIGELPSEWNHCVGYDEPRPDAKLVHYTMGIPHFEETKGCEYSDEWWKEYNSMTAGCSWLALMGKSIHAKKVLPRYFE